MSIPLQFDKISLSWSRGGLIKVNGRELSEEISYRFHVRYM